MATCGGDDVWSSGNPGHRLFSSVAAAWRGCNEGTSDVKELVPEFFYEPEFLRNADGHSLGTRQVRHPLNLKKRFLLIASSLLARAQFSWRAKAICVKFHEQTRSQNACTCLDLAGSRKQGADMGSKMGDIKRAARL